MPLFKALFDTLKRVKHSTPQPVFCPRCSSPKIRRIQNYGILPTIYYCNNCGYEGTIIIELEPEEVG